MYSGQQSTGLAPPTMLASAASRIVDTRLPGGFTDRNVGGELYSHTTGVFVDVLNLTLAGTNTSLPDPQTGESFSNTTVAEIHYKATVCAQVFCTDMPQGFDGRGAAPTVTDREISDGLLRGGGSVLLRGKYGHLLVEAFEVLVDLSQRGDTGRQGRHEPSMSPVAWLQWCWSRYQSLIRPKMYFLGP